MKRLVKFLLSSLLVTTFFSCNIGLGQAVDLQAPEVTITKPEVASTNPQTIIVEGTAKDNIDVTDLYITVEETNQEFKLIPGEKWKQKVNDSWIEYLVGSSNVSNDVLSFTLYIDILNPKTGNDYTIVTQAYDAMRNEGKTSKDERVITVDITAPSVFINEPVLETNYLKASSDSSSYKLEDNSILSSLYNKDVKVSGYQKDECKLDRLIVYIDDGTTDTIPEKEEDNTVYLYKEEISGTNIRNWNFTLQASKIPSQYQTNKHLFRIFTYSYDVAGNCERKVHGWFTYYNEADKPWVYATFGVDSKDDITSKTYPNCNMLGQAYDDDGLKEISITTKKEDGTIVSKLTKTINLDADGNPKYYAWSTNAISETGIFYVTVKCKDINGIESSSITKWAEVDDITPPTVVVTSSDKLPLTTTEFSVAGRVEDDCDINRVLIVRKPENESQEIEYLNGYTSEKTQQASNIWNLTKTGTDKNGNKMWVIDLKKVNKYQTDANVWAKDFSFDFDWETDFGIKTDFSSGKLTSMSFIICAIDNYDLSRTSLVTLGGDSQKPELSITKVIVYDKNGKIKEEKEFGSETPELQPFYRDVSNNITDKVQLVGTWNDDSKYLKNISFSWKDNTNSITITKKDNGTWETNKIMPPDLTTAVISAELEDLGGNKANASTSFYVNGAMAQYLRISSDMPDAHYKKGTKIDIYLEFTKNVEFKDGTAEPELVLNNGAKAKYKEGNGTSARHVFEYTVGDNETCKDKLTVSKILTYGHKWYDGTNCFWNTDGDDEIKQMSSNLDANRSIYIDTTPPKLENISAITQEGYYKAGSNIYIAATFSEEINNVNGLALKLNTGKTTDSVKKTGSKDALFTYTVKSGDNVENLSVTDIEWGSSSIKDLADNDIDKENSKKTETFTGINLDTTTPKDGTITVSPTPSGTGTTKVVYNKSFVTVTIKYDKTETTGVRKYTTDYKEASTNWSEATINADGEQIITLANGEYKISAYQEDEAGNKTSEVTPVNFNVDYGHILKSVSVDKPSGTYGKDTTITIKLNFRNIVQSADSRIKINIGGSGKELSPETGSSGSKTFTYKYKTVNGDSCDKLEITEMSGTYKDEYGNDISELVNYKDSSNKLISGVVMFDNEIKVDTTAPEVTNVELDGTNLRITYNSEIQKGTTGDVILTMKDYRAPPYFTKENWGNYSAAVGDYYESTTQGCDKDGKADLSEKYVLKFDYDITNEEIINKLKAKGVDADKATMSINSSDVEIDSTDKKTLVLKFGSKIPVKGAEYDVTIPNGLVQNKINTPSSGDTSHSVMLAGIEQPVIRIKKANSKVNVSNKAITSVELPTEAEARIDCQTPGSTIKYKMITEVSSGFSLTDIGNNTVAMNGKKIENSAFDFDDDSVTETSYTEKSTFSLSAGTGNDDKGCQIRIQAKASKEANADKNYNAPVPVYSYEQAMKTVIILINRGAANGYNYRCIRGGDNTYGGVSTPGFPFSWNTSEYNKIQTMSGSGNTDGSEYKWTTWSLTTIAYINFLAADGTDYTDDGYPNKWWWASCSWVPQVANYLVNPGETSTYDANNILPYFNGGFQFQTKHKQAASSN